MANIDDFFAKKDKKKKGTKKFSKANTEVIAKNLIETEKKELKEMEKQEKEINTQYSEQTPNSVVKSNSNEDEEWDDYRENKKDFSGLKIESLSVADQAPDEDEDETEINEDGEVVKVKKDESGPWNKLTGTGTNEVQQQDTIPEPEPCIQTPNVVAGSYVPPHMRGSGGGGGSNSAPPSSEARRPAPRRSKLAPDINSEVYFPALSSAQEDSGPKGAWGSGGSGSGGGGSSGGMGNRARTDDVGSFEEVQQRGSQGYSRQSEAPKLALGNKFAALRESGVGEKE